MHLLSQLSALSTKITFLAKECSDSLLIDPEKANVKTKPSKKPITNIICVGRFYQRDR